MLYPIIRRIRRPLLPPEFLQVAAPAVAEATQAVVEPPSIVSPMEATVAPVAEPSPAPEPVIPPVEPKPPVTPTKTKRAKAAEEKSRKTAEPRE